MWSEWGWCVLLTLTLLITITIIIERKLGVYSTYTYWRDPILWVDTIISAAATQTSTLGGSRIRMSSDPAFVSHFYRSPDVSLFPAADAFFRPVLASALITNPTQRASVIRAFKRSLGKKNTTRDLAASVSSFFHQMVAPVLHTSSDSQTPVVLLPLLRRCVLRANALAFFGFDLGRDPAVLDALLGLNHDVNVKRLAASLPGLGHLIRSHAASRLALLGESIQAATADCDPDSALGKMVAFGWSPPQMAASVFVALYAGGTTAKAVQNALHLVLESDSHTHSLLSGASEEELDAILWETLRVTTGPLAIRAEIGHDEFLLGFSPYHAHRDVSVWGQDARSFDPLRFMEGGRGRARDLHAFGHGRHACPGKAIALLTGRTLLRHLFQGWDWDKPGLPRQPPGGQSDAGDSFSFTVPGLGIPLRPEVLPTTR